ncbi:hypothetical protein ACVBEQ_14735 [Nakamurella sp. GG22]
MYSSVAAVGSLGRNEVRSVLNSVTKWLPDSDDWSLDCAGLGFEIRYTGPGGQQGRVDDRDLLVRCGRIILDLRVAIRARGVHPTVQLLPDDDEPDLLAIVLPQGRSVPTPDDLALSEAIKHRRGRPAAVPGVPAETMLRLRQAAKMEQSWIATLSHEQVDAIRTGSSVAEVSANLSVSGSAANVRQQGSPVTAVIGSLRDLPTARLQAGQALERVLLTATSTDLAATVLPDLLADSARRRKVRDLVGGGLWPHCVVRLGDAAQVASAAQRYGTG